MEEFGSLLFSVPPRLIFLDICFGWVTVVAVSFIWNSFYIMNGKGWEILKISQSTCREKWVVLMGSHKAWVVQEAAWSSGFSNGFKPCLLVVKSLWTFFLVWKYMSFSLNSVNIAVPSATWLSSSKFSASLLQSAPGWRNTTSSSPALPTFVVTTWRGGTRGIENVREGKTFPKLWITPKISIWSHLSQEFKGYFINQRSLPKT